MAQPHQPATDSPATTQDIQTRERTLITDINSGSIDKVRTDMIDDARKYGSVRAQQIFGEASRNANLVGLGFPQGSFLTGVNGENVIAQTGGDAQHPQYQQRSIRSVGVGDVQTPATPTAATDLGTRGHSQMTVNADGSGTVTKGNDALWTIAQKIIEQRQGRATQTDIGNFVNQITAYNRQTNPNFNPDNPPQQFGVPPQVRGDTGVQAPTPYDPARPGSRMATTDVAPSVTPPTAPVTGDLSSPVAPPGLDGPPGQTWNNSKDWRDLDGVQNPTPDRDGNVTRKYTGGLHDGLIGFRTGFNSEETVDAHNNLVHSFVKYDGSGPTLKIKPDGGQEQTIENVRSVETQYNPGTGRYQTTYIRANGDRLVTSTDRQGRVAMGPGANSPEAQTYYTGPQ